MSLVPVATKEAQRAEELAFLAKSPFDFSLVKRNAILAASGMKMPLTKKTGTTIAGLVYADGVVLGADTRATEGSIVCDKNCEKIHHISRLIYCCGAGTSADTENVTGITSSQLELHRLATGKEPKVITALTRLKQRLFQYQGHVSAALVLGGIDSQGAHIYTVYPHGSTDRLPFATMGSGSLAAMAVFEHGYRDDLDEKSAVDLVDQAIQSGIFNDLGSGSNVDICVISKTHGVKYLRNFKKPVENEKSKQAIKTDGKSLFPRGSTTWISETKRTFKNDIIVKDLKEVNVGSMMEVSA